MVAPITGPFTSNVDYTAKPPGVTWTYVKRRRERTWYRQRRPYNLPLSYYFYDRWTEKYNDLRGGIYYSAYTNAPSFDSTGKAYAYNKAYGKFVDKLGEKSMWAVNIHERKQALSSVATHANTLVRFTRLVRRRRFKQAARELKMHTVPSGIRKKNPWAQNWLEYHLGWEQLVKDIGAGLETLTRDFPTETVVARASSNSHSATETSHNSTSWHRVVTHYETKVRLQATVSVSNPNVFLLNQLGFVNPVGIAWELVPFSFVVDWFANVGQVLGSLTEWFGLQLADSFTSTKQEAWITDQWIGGDLAGSTFPRKGDLFIDALWKMVYSRRELGLSAPTLKLRPFKGFSVVRGATAIALLLQVMKQ